MLDTSLGSVELDKEEKMQVNDAVSSNYVFIASIYEEVADFLFFLL